MRFASTLLTVTFLGLAGCGGEESADATLVDVEKGMSSGITSARTQVIYTQAELDALWAQHDPGIAAPTIDFSQHMVIAAFHGFAGTPGYDIEVVSANAGGGALNVVLRYSTPGPTCGGGALVYYPFHIVRRARNDNPASFSSTTVQSC